MTTFLLDIFGKVEDKLDKLSPYYGSTMISLQAMNVLYILLYSLFGVVLMNQSWLRKTNTMIQILLCIILLIKYHPFREHEFKKNDAKLIFGSALFLFFNLGIIEYLNAAVSNLQNNIQNTIRKLEKTME